MLQLENTPDVKLIFTLMFDNPVLSAVLGECHFDEKYIYFPEANIGNKTLVNEFVKKGLVKRVDKVIL